MNAIRARVLLAAIVALAVLSCAPEIKLSDRDWKEINSDKNTTLVTENSSDMVPSVTWDSTAKEVTIELPNEADILRQSNNYIINNKLPFLKFYSYSKGVTSLSADNLGMEYSYSFVKRLPSDPSTGKTKIIVSITSITATDSLVAKISAKDYTFANGKKLGNSYDTKAGHEYYNRYTTRQRGQNSSDFANPYKSWELNVGSPAYSSSTSMISVGSLSLNSGLSYDEQGQIANDILPGLVGKFQLEKFVNDRWQPESGNFTYQTYYPNSANLYGGTITLNYTPQDFIPYRVRVNGVENLTTASLYYGVNQRIRVNGWFSKKTCVTDAEVWVRSSYTLATGNTSVIKNFSLRTVDVANKSIELWVVFNPINNSTITQMDPGTFRKNFKVFVPGNSSSTNLDDYQFLNIKSIEFSYSEVHLKLDADYTYETLPSTFGILIGPGFKYTDSNIIFGNYANWGDWVVDGVRNFDSYYNAPLGTYSPPQQSQPSASRTVTFDLNGAIGTPPGNVSTTGSAITLPNLTVTRPGYTFIGWSANATGFGTIYNAGASIDFDSIPASGITLYAIWQSGGDVPGNTPATPTGVYMTASSSSSISLSWNSVNGASYYNVYWASSAFGSYSEAGYTYTNSYTDTGLSASTTYYYRVSAVNSNGDESELSTYTAATTSGGGVWPPSSTTSLSSGTWVNDSFSLSNTEDWYSFNVTSGTTYYVHWKDSDNPGDISGVMDVKVAAYYSNQTLIFDGDISSRSFTASSSGTVYVKVYPYGSGSGNYAIAYNTSSTEP